MIERFSRSLLVACLFLLLLWLLEGTKELSIGNDKVYVLQQECILAKRIPTSFLTVLWDTSFHKKVYIIYCKLMCSSLFHAWILMAMFAEIIAAP